jgi:hypothetical protein
MTRPRPPITPLLLSVALLGADAEDPGIKLRAHPLVSLAPLRGLRNITLTAEIVGPETEEYYCPEVVWLWPNGSRSIEESDCPPFESRTDYPRIFVRRLGSPAHIRDYEVCVVLRKAGEAFDRGCVKYSVR